MGPRPPLTLAHAAWLDEVACRAWVSGVFAARAAWTKDFGGEQFSLGRAFYAHLETDRAREYFADAAASDARVEAAAPGLQRRMMDVAASIVGGDVRPRRGWCGPGVHVFPAGEHVARAGGVVHFDIEGLTAGHLAQRRRAVTVVAMLQPAEAGGGLRLWDVTYTGREALDDAELTRESVVIDYRAGDVVAIDSYRAHQIQPFTGARDRVSATTHLAEIDRGVWESWF